MNRITKELIVEDTEIRYKLTNEVTKLYVKVYSYRDIIAIPEVKFTDIQLGFNTGCSMSLNEAGIYVKMFNDVISFGKEKMPQLIKEQIEKIKKSKENE